ncbi:MAG: ChbG/HpnK family deacetylase [Anaerolineae bacterium]|nr:MAG: ChbG/HpnK family deacetylase [Anaerolineae bacterium]
MSGLIINADDLGYSPTVNRAIADLFAAGLITSASLLVNQPASEEARPSPAVCRACRWVYT